MQFRWSARALLLSFPQVYGPPPFSRRDPCMARDQVDMTPIETRDELVAWLAAGVKPKQEFRIGTEHEKFAFTLSTREPVPYEGTRGIRALLRGMQMLMGWEAIVEGQNIIGLSDVTGGGAISLEPGGQFELSGAPVETIHQTCTELMAHRAQVHEVARPLGIGFLVWVSSGTANHSTSRVL